MVSAAIRTKQWLLSPNRDFFLIHGGCGLLFLPLWFLAQWIPGTWTIAVYPYTYLLSKPHMAATWVRMGDTECRKYLPLLGWIAPLAIGISVYLTIVVWKGLAYANLAIFLVSLFHQALQNFGIMRAYVVKSGLSTQSLTSRWASLAVQAAPFACVFSFLAIWMPRTFFLIPLWLPPRPVLEIVATIFVLTALVALAGYSICEYRDWAQAQGSPGRLCCVLSAVLVYALAYPVTAEIQWGYFIASSWHCIQYLAFNQAYRQNPPVGAQLLQLSPLKYILLILAFTATIFLIQSGFIVWMAVVYPITGFTIGFHHYFADAFLWRRRRNMAQVPS